MILLPLSFLSSPYIRIFSIFFLFLVGIADAQTPLPIPKVTFGVENATEPQDIAVTLQIVALLTILSLAPSIVVMMTGFVRIVVVLNFIKKALGTPEAPPNQMVMGLALFLTFFVMAPTFNRINDEALQPYMKKEINYQQGLERAIQPLREFMLRQTGEKELALFVRATHGANPKTVDDLPMSVVIPAFVLSELKTAFIIGFLIYIPFLVIDMAVASILMSMGMMMLPPVMISMPFKLILFVMVDGWNLIVQQLLLSFH